MTLSVSDQVPPVGSKLVVDTDADETVNTSVTGAAGNIYQIDIDNTANADNSAFLKIYDDAAPVVGTTPPDHIMKVPVSQRRGMVIPDGLAFNDLSFAVVISGGTSGTTGPTSSVIVKMVTS